MQRDLDLIRQMLLKLEDDPHGRPTDWGIEGYSDEAVGYHAYLLVDAGFAKGSIIDFESAESPSAQIYYLTWEGHEFSAAARDDSSWKQAMKIVKEKGGAITVSVLTQLLLQFAKMKFGI